MGKHSGKPVYDYTRQDLLDAMRAEMNIEVKYNIRLRAFVVRRHRPGCLAAIPEAYDHWNQVTDGIEKNIRNWLADNCAKATSDGRLVRWRLPNDFYDICWGSLASHAQFDPVKEWFNGLPDWDGIDRIETLLIDLFNVEDTPLNRWATMTTFAGAVNRTYNPGAKLDEIPILIGGQRAGKSAYVSSLVPPEYKTNWFVDQFELNSTLKEKSEQTAGALIVEIAEMAGAERASVKQLKTWITSATDGQHRDAYAKNKMPRPRMWVAVGSANKDGAGSIPEDSTGSRRYVAVECNRGPHRPHGIEGYIADIREQLWAEALHKHEHSARFPVWADGRLPDELFLDQAEANKGHEIADELREMVATITRPRVMTLQEVGFEVGLVPSTDQPLHRRDQHRLAEALTATGWHKERQYIDGKQRNVWVPK